LFILGLRVSLLTGSVALLALELQRSKSGRAFLALVTSSFPSVGELDGTPVQLQPSKPSNSVAIGKSVKTTRLATTGPRMFVEAQEIVTPHGDL